MKLNAIAWTAGLMLLVPLLSPWADVELLAQGVTTAAISGSVTDDKGEPLPGANVVAIHEPTGTRYGTPTRGNGQFNIANMRIGGPYTITATIVGYKESSQKDVFLAIGQDSKLNFQLVEQAIEGKEVVVTAERDAVMNSGRTGAATFISPDQVQELPSIERSTRDLTRLDPRSDGNFSFGGKNWLYNNISLDGSYFNNPFGLDDPAPGGQANAEPVPFDAVEQVQVSIAPFDVREGGFTGAGINTVTKSGTNQVKASLYSFIRNESLLGNEVSGEKVVADPDLSFMQSGFSASGPIIPNKLFFFVNGEIERRDDPGTNYDANRGTAAFGISRPRATTLDSISQRLRTVYGYETGGYDNFIHETNNEKILVKLDWNAHENHNVSFRFNMLDAKRDLPPHPFVLSAFNSGRGPNENSLPFQNSGYKINNDLMSYALEVNSRSDRFANRFFASYNRFRDNRDPFSKPFPTIEIAEGGVTLTTAGHEPFSINNILDQDVLQLTDNFTYYAGAHALTVGINYEKFSFYNSFNIFRYGLFQIPLQFGGSTFSSVAEFFRYTDPNDSLFRDFNAEVAAAEQNPFKGEDIDVGQLSFYAQDEFQVSPTFNLLLGIRVDIPQYITQPVDNPFSRGLTALDENGNPEVVDQSKLPDETPLFSPRVGFNWDVNGDRTTQVRGGTGIFTGRIPFVWIGNVISNPGQNPILPPHQRSFDVNAATADFKWPQIWGTNVAIDQSLPWDMLGTLEAFYGQDINAIYVRNADLVRPVRTLPDGRPFYGAVGGNGANELNADFGAGIYVIDNTSEGHNFHITAQLRKAFSSGINTGLSYTYTEAKSNLKSTEIASVLFSGNPVVGNPNRPELSFSEFGNRHRIVGNATYRHEWSEMFATSFGLFFEVAEGNRFAGAGGNRYSFTYAGDVNGDGQSGNDLIYIPRNSGEIIFVQNGSVTPAQQWEAFNAFIEQDEYLNSRRGQIAERFGETNPWFSNIDLRILQDIIFMAGTARHTIQLSVDILNVANLLNSDWGVRSSATSTATSPLVHQGFDTNGAPTFTFNTATTETFVDDVGVFSRWQVQLGLRYLFN